MSLTASLEHRKENWGFPQGGLWEFTVKLRYGDLFVPHTQTILLLVLERIIGTSQVAIVVKNPPARARDLRDVGSIPGLGRSSGAGHGSPLQYSHLENPMERGAWWTTVHRGAKSQTRQSDLAQHGNILNAKKKKKNLTSYFLTHTHTHTSQQTYCV